MLSPSTLLFGGEVLPDLAAEEKPAWQGGLLELLDSDGEEQTDVPADCSLATSLHESDEDRKATPVIGDLRRSRLGGSSHGVISRSPASGGAAEVADTPTGQSSWHAHGCERLPGLGSLLAARPGALAEGACRAAEQDCCWPMQGRPPPGLGPMPVHGVGGGLIASESRAAAAVGVAPNLVPPLPADPAPAKDGDESGPDAEDDADDEQSHRSSDIGAADGLRSISALQAGLAQSSEVTGEDLSMWYAELPSIGSANHFNGTCDRCCFHPKGRCMNGWNCQHCHFDHEKRKRKNKKKKGKLGIDADSEATSTCADGSLPMTPENAVGTAISASALAAAAAGDFAPQMQQRPPAPAVSSADARSGFAQQSAQYYDAAATGAWYRQAEPLGSQPLSSRPLLSTPSAVLGTVPASAPLIGTALQDGTNYPVEAAVPASAYGDFVGHAAGLPGDACTDELGFESGLQASFPAGDRGGRDEYIRQLEMENRYLRAYIAQLVGSTTGSAQPAAELGSALEAPQQAIPPVPPMAPPAAPTAPPATGAAAMTQALSPSAAPFVPSGRLAAGAGSEGGREQR